MTSYCRRIKRPAPSLQFVMTLDGVPVSEPSMGPGKTCDDLTTQLVSAQFCFLHFHHSC